MSRKSLLPLLLVLLSSFTLRAEVIPVTGDVACLLREASDEAEKRGAAKTVQAIEKLLKSQNITEEDLYKLLNTISKDEQITNQYTAQRAGLIKELGESPELLKNVMKYE